MKIIPTREELISLLPKNSIGVEIGVWKGQFSKILLDIVQPKMLYLIDPWEGIIPSGDKNGNNVVSIDGPDYFIQNILPEFLFIDNVKVLKTYSSIIQLFPDNYLDWVYIDGDHQYEGVTYDLEVSYPKLKQGGFILGHDYTNKMFPSVVKAVDDFCKKYNLEIEYITEDGCPSYFITKKMNKETFRNIVKPYTMTSDERINSLYDSLEYIRKNNIQGDFIECGVWAGGNILGIMSYLEYYNMNDRTVWLYDTFEGMTPPEDIDVDLNGNKAQTILNSVMCIASLEQVKQNISLSKFPNVKFVIGDIVETLNDKNNIPNNIALLRLDTDWYQSTKKEMEILYPLLSEKGVLIVDDYGHWEGSKIAIDEYFQNINQTPIIEQIDYTGIKIIK